MGEVGGEPLRMICMNEQKSCHGWGGGQIFGPVKKGNLHLDSATGAVA